MQNPLVSIIVPSYNTEKYIRCFILSVINQSYENWELIVVDDGSTDATLEIINDFCTQDNRIKLLERNRTPKGSVTCRNIGQAVLKGEYFMHVDSDDYLVPECLSQRVRFMENNPQVEYATFKGAAATFQGDKYEYTGRFWGIDPKDNLIKRFLSINYPFSVWNNIYRSNRLKNYYWDENVKIYTDFSYIIPLLIDNVPHAFADDSEIDYIYRVGRANAMTSDFISDEKYESTKYLFDKTQKMISKSTKYVEYKKAFRRFYNLQFDRIIVTRNKLQIDDFYEFYRNTYGQSFAKRILIMLVKKKIIKNQKCIHRINVILNGGRLIK